MEVSIERLVALERAARSADTYEKYRRLTLEARKVAAALQAIEQVANTGEGGENG